MAEDYGNGRDHRYVSLRDDRKQLPGYSLPLT